VLGSDAPQLRLIARTQGREQVVRFEEQPVLVIGSRRDCAMSLGHVDVSKIHCAIINTGRAVFACDLKSRTGTRLNGEPIDVCRLSGGEKLLIGDTEIEVELTGGPRGKGPANPFLLERPITLRCEESEHRLEQALSRIGRRNGCDITLDDPDVSLVHALVFCLHDRPAIFDLGSRGGTFVNESPVTLAWLRDEDRLAVATTQFDVEWKGAPPPEPVVEAVAEGAAAEPVHFDGADLESIEATLASLEEVIQASRDRLEAQSAELERREQEFEARLAELDARDAAVRDSEQSAEQQAEQRLAAVSEQEQAVAQLREQVESERAALEELQAGVQERRLKFDEQEAALQAQRDELAAREAKLGQAEASQEEINAMLERERGEIEQGRAALADERAQLEAARSELDNRVTEFESLKGELDARESDVNTRNEELEARASELQARAAEFESRSAEFESRAAELDQRQAALDQRRGEFDRRDAEFEETGDEVAARERTLQAREQELQQRAADLERRAAELEDQRHDRKELVEKIAKARSAIETATRMFTTEPNKTTESSGGSGGSGGDKAAKQPGVSNGKGSAHANGKSAKAAKAESKIMSADGHEEEALPGPIVDEPIFSGGETHRHGGTNGNGDLPAPGDLSPDLQERFRVLRRLSTKPDADIVQQLLAEVRQSEPEEDDKKKGKRRWWS
jgi:pSer/pThr/pTyr-binding forkhead associated (FHA) protein